MILRTLRVRDSNPRPGITSLAIAEDKVASERCSGHKWPYHLLPRARPASSEPIEWAFIWVGSLSSVARNPGYGDYWWLDYLYWLG